MQETVISIQSAEKTFPNGVQGLAPITLDIFPKERISLIGPSGCGKSTLLKLIANLHQPSEGSLSWWNKDFSEVGKENHRLSFVFQEPTLMPWSTVRKNVRLPLDLEGIAPAVSEPRVQEALKVVGLEHAAERFPAQLSGGMKMRVSIARALVTRPNLLLMDEPFGALDELTRNRLDEDMANLCGKDDLTLLFVTHSLYEAAFLSTRVMVMAAHPGRIFAEYEIDPAIPRDEAFRLSDTFAMICQDLSKLLIEASHSSLVAKVA
ncbi:nitrate/sulfonate/bicarbonate ABC transporter ATP-binding protein [Acetobacter pomorum]|uniref:Nitrate/sulfonate/bicarbonate ABC transporter ATP-binding protein n=1 Tax=Acetobacter pomorum TaxID=65959 RepID=A0A2G4RBJ5_9PROT|nr:ABC transporter ATP-binding protein [Acetobacter pomorum]PHY93890.1 nitrate/sulfonate/bicarbonate ABC transporter ATP-binding protein [Acetobacter pomorum]GBR53933.1 nitrate/sulfonate/bicarbonate transporter ATP-binding protein [Acetobacter pomorum DSM 11825]